MEEEEKTLIKLRENAKEFYEEQRKIYNTDNIRSNPNPDYSELFYQNIFDLMADFANKSSKAKLKELLPFSDSYGNKLQLGNKFIIERHYNFHHFEDKICEVIWDKNHGMYKYKFYSKTGYAKKLSKTEDDFYGVAKFKKIT